MDEQSSDVLKRLELIEQKLSDMDSRFESIESQLAGNTVPLRQKKPKGKMLLRICIPILLICLLVVGYFAFRAIRKPTYAKAEIGDVITFGQYEQNNSETDGLEPVEWIVLDKQDGKLLLLSKYTLYTSQITSGVDLSWRYSKLKKTLNSDFISSAFSPQEQNLICTTENEEDEHISQDRVFLLSKEEIERYYPTEESRKGIPTATCVNKSNVSDNAYYWWTRTRDNTNRYYLVMKDGDFKTAGDRTTGVRPALWLDTTK